MTEFKKELAQVWPQISNKPFFFALLAGWLLLFQLLGNSSFGYMNTPSLLEWMYHTYSQPNSDDSHGLLIPFAVLGLIWWKRKQLLELPQKASWIGVALIFVATVIHLTGYLVQQPRISILAFFVGLYGLVGLAWGWKWMKTLFFPFVLFAYCMPLSSLDLLTSITLPLRIMAATVSTAIAHSVLGLDVIRQGTQIFNPSHAYGYEVEAACSGIRSLIALSALMMIYAMMNYQSRWKRTAIVLLSIPLALICNILRVLTMIVVGETFGQHAAKLSDDWSWLATFAIAMAVMFVISRFWEDKRPTTAVESTEVLA